MPDTDRTSRASESRAADNLHDASDELEDIDFNPANLDTRNIPPREGYVQRWVRTKTGSKDDPSNVYRSSNMGWKPRQASTIKKGAMVPSVEYDGDDIVGVHDMILMERPVSIDKKHQAYQQRMTDGQMQAVDSDLLKVHDKSSGMGRPSSNNRSRVSTGRVAPVSSD
jgi:hypothetical protein